MTIFQFVYLKTFVVQEAVKGINNLHAYLFYVLLVINFEMLQYKFIAVYVFVNKKSQH